MFHLDNSIMNVTTALSSGVGTGSWFSMVGVVMVFVIFLGLFMSAVSSLESYVKTKKWLMWLLSTTQYFMFGILALICLAIPISIFYYFFSQARKGNVAPLKITLIIIGGYILITLIGYISKKYVYERIKKFEKQIGKEK